MRDFETLLYQESDGVGVVTLNRPEVHNAFNRTMQMEMRELWMHLRRHEEVRVVVITGAGEKAFCSGIDRTETIEEGFLKEGPTWRRVARAAGFVASPFQYNDAGLDINPKQNGMWKPVVTAVNGMACAGGLYLLGESDVIIAAEHATFFDPHVTYGMVAGFEPTHLLQKLPFGDTLRVALVGSRERLSAARAYELGLVSEVVAPSELMGRARDIALHIAEAPLDVLEGTLRAIWLAHDSGRRAALAHAAAAEPARPGRA
ncbi:MAG TPA: enoyl-CoA hydratase/isomerase family protein [Acidimicrobiales bacterium]|nr:enoyl-CoA hydratase/isomerase family protein [Acidimicrobiales bacterium]